MAYYFGSLRRVFCGFRCHKSCVSRCYSIQPPEWLGGKNKLIRSGRWDFPEHAQTFKEKMAKLEAHLAKTSSPKQTVDVGTEFKSPARDRGKMITIVNENRKNKDLEQLSRLRKLKVPLDVVRQDWLSESGIVHAQTLAEHYGVYKDLFNDDYFTPVVQLAVCYDYSDDLMTPVYYGNRIPPIEASRVPHVHFTADSDTLWTLLLTNPDGHLSDPLAEYVHWLVGNIPGNDVSAGELLVDYIQPFPAKGTGFQRYIFVLFQQKRHIDFSQITRTSPCKDITQRTHNTPEFFGTYRDLLVPMGVAFFQSEWDDSVRQVYHNFFDMAEPSYEYEHPVTFHPPPKKYPHKEPFDRYFDRYRDKKDIAEEVLRMKLQMVSPFEPHDAREKYPLVHRAQKYKPSWLKLREELMHRRLEQFKDLP